MRSVARDQILESSDTRDESGEYCNASLTVRGLNFLFFGLPLLTLGPRVGWT